MKSQTSTKLALSAAIVLGWTSLAALSCSESILQPDPEAQGCKIIKDSNFPTDGNFYLNKPANCPIGIPGVTQIPYAATADFANGTVAAQSYENTIITWNGYTSGSIYNSPVWSQGSNGRVFVQISGDYYAARGGPQYAGNNSGYDDVKNGFFSYASNSWTYATTRVTYVLGAPANNTVKAPSSVNPGTNYGVSATTNDPILTNPVTWSWYVNNSFVGTSSNPLFTVHSGGPSTQQVVKVVASDESGHSVSGQTTVSALALSAYISGYDAVNTDWYSTWTAHVSGGTPPYTYAWSGLFSGSGSSISGTTSTDGDLILNVYDSSGAHVTDTKHISSTGCSGRNLC